ncbi:MAG: hypothetical protein Q8J92_14730 [Parvibaculum sp.]|uniref:DUF6614 family protein n=1 Tax=Parvibaculum sp. TaxID=2024848 RepID=UPI002721890D|nr:DUF6614 family protein [Parvibaculum sp.]MDO8839349.1 hypothetical protein [Parvibaculum sp.]MDP1628468.1 hypothetical protein [Parvibaculum sp.]MDP2125627.1 hypothetical protein [Parvibaculum sp.]
MDIYHGWFNLKPGVRDIDFVEAFTGYMELLEREGVIEGWRLTRKKLGLGPAHLGEFHFMIEVTDLTQLDSAFNWVATRADPVETEHFNVNSLVTDIQFALYRDFPDPVREQGEERF